MARLRGKETVSELFHGSSGVRSAAPSLFSVAAADWLADAELHEEVFGPVALIVHAASEGQMAEIAAGLDGQLTAILHLYEADHDLARSLLPLQERKAGRLIVNGFPTGVGVFGAMVYGGPYPASTNFGATSVGTLAVRRFLRPVCYQDFPPELLPQF